MNKYPWVYAGDFNTKPGDELYQFITEKGNSVYSLGSEWPYFE